MSNTAFLNKVGKDMTNKANNINTMINTLIADITKGIEECLTHTHTCGYCDRKYTPSEMGGSNEHFCSEYCMDASRWERYEDQCPLDTITDEELEKVFDNIPEEYEEIFN